MKSSNKFFFLIFFTFLTIPYSLVSVHGYTSTIRADWLYVETGTFIDNSPHSWETNIKIASGGVDLLSFENLGIISSSDTEVLYKARVIYGFEITAHTNVDYGKAFPYINRDKQHTEQFFRINRIYFGYDRSSIHVVSWNSIELGTMREHNYDGNIPVTVGIREILGNSGTITLNGQTFDTPAYVADIVRTKVTEVRSGEVGGYEDQFTNVADVTEGNVKFQELDDDFSASESKIIAYYSNANLGWTAGSIQRGLTLQQLMVDASQKGVEFHNSATSDSYTFLLYTQIQPEVYEFVQYNTIRYATINYWTFWPVSGNIDSIVGPATRTADKRIVAVHTVNSFIHWEFEMIVEFYATVESTAKLTQAILGDPYLRAGDIIWDVSFTGDYKVDVPVQKEDLWDILGGLFGGLFGNIWNILLLVAVIIIATVILYVIIKSRSRRVMRRFVRI